MGATNSTLNYQLSQFIATDKPAWLQDYNGDMEKIDVGINTAKVAADTAQNTANSAVSSISTVTSDITALQTDVSAHTNDITDLQGDVNTIESLIGNGIPTTTDHTIIGAINEINAKVNVNILDISASTRYNDVSALIATSLAAGKVPHILADLSYIVAGNTYNKKVCFNYVYDNVNNEYAFAIEVSNGNFVLYIRPTETLAGSSVSGATNITISNAKFYY